MDLPNLADLNEFNRVLLVVAQLFDPSRGCNVRPIINTCSSFILGGHIVDHYRTLKLCNYAGLTIMTKSQVKLTEQGKQFLSCNPNNVYEITEQQKVFVAEHLILNGPWQSGVRSLLLSFSPNYSRITYELILAEDLPQNRYNAAVHLLLILGILSKEDGKLIVDPKYVQHVRQLRAIIKGVSEQELEQALQLNLKLSDLAEEAVLEYERERLKSIGRNAESELLRRISKLKVEAGYDIESFDGDKPLFDYDRFIEVKASYENVLRFFWSDNEHRVAREKGDKYWIYFVGGLSSTKAKSIVPILIQNPIKRLGQVSEIDIKVATYLIEQNKEIPLKEFSRGKVRGYYL